MYRRDIVPLGSKRSKFNYNLDEKRVLNFENVVNDDDNIKQDMSIDVYGRKTDDDDQPQNGAAEVGSLVRKDQLPRQQVNGASQEYSACKKYGYPCAGSSSRRGGRGCTRCSIVWMTLLRSYIQPKCWL